MLDIARWWIETDKLSPMRRDLHRAMLLTGARRSSILSVRRADVDLDRAVLTFRHMKIGGPMMLPMGRRLTEMLKTRLAADVVLGSEWLWPSPTSACGHVVEPKEKRRGDLPSSHEYRHLARTLFIASGAPYAESALLLGQKLPGASGGYIHPEHLIEHLRPSCRHLRIEYSLRGQRGCCRQHRGHFRDQRLRVQRRVSMCAESIQPSITDIHWTGWPVSFVPEAASGVGFGHWPSKPRCVSRAISLSN
jgi:hypothetical protein